MKEAYYNTYYCKLNNTVLFNICYYKYIINILF